MTKWILTGNHLAGKNMSVAFESDATIPDKFPEMKEFDPTLGPIEERYMTASSPDYPGKKWKKDIGMKNFIQE